MPLCINHWLHDDLDRFFTFLRSITRIDDHNRAWAWENKQRHLAQLMHAVHRPAGVGMLAAMAAWPPTADIVTCRLHDLVTCVLQ